MAWGISHRVDLDFSNPVGAPIPRRLIQAVLNAFQRTRSSGRHHAVSVALVDRRAMRRLQRTYRQVNADTDVLSFPATPWPGQPPALGEVVICYPVAVQHARRYRHRVRQEVVELLIHGLVHLAGYQHTTSALAKKMAAFEAKILAQVKRRGGV